MQYVCNPGASAQSREVDWLVRHYLRHISIQLKFSDGTDALTMDYAEAAELVASLQAALGNQR